MESDWEVTGNGSQKKKSGYTEEITLRLKLE